MLKYIAILLLIMLNHFCSAQQEYKLYEELWINDQLYVLDTTNGFKYFTKDSIYFFDNQNNKLISPISMDEFAKTSNLNANLASVMENNTALLCDKNFLKTMTYRAFLDSVEIQYLKLSSMSDFNLCDIYKSLCYGNVIDEKIMQGYTVPNEMMNYKMLFDSIFNTYCESNPKNYEVVVSSPLLDNILFDIDPIQEIAINKLLKLYSSCPIKQDYLIKGHILLVHINFYEEALSIFGSPFQGTPYISDWPQLGVD